VSSTAEVLDPRERSGAEKSETGEDSEGRLPVTVIEPRRGWQLINLREMWRFRELLFFLVWRDVKARYKQTVLGASWAVLQPLAMMAAFSLFVGRVAGKANADMPYPLFVFSGLLPWTFFNAAVAAAGNSVVSNRHIVTKVYFPRLLVPASAVGAPVLDFAIAFALLLGLMPVFGALPDWRLLAVPPVLAVLASLTLGLGVLLASLTVSYRDFRLIVPLALQMWMFATPAMFMQDMTVFGPRTAALLPLNPLHGVVVNFRAATAGGAFDLPALDVSALWGLGLLLLGCFCFRRAERGFADII
jgi:lipopolysaccharide transport system permease protein